MHTKRRTWVVLGLAVVLALSLAAPAGAASDKRIAGEGVIQDGDVPSSWTSEPSDDSDDKEVAKAARKVPDCRMYLKARATLDRVRHAESDDFNLGEESLSNEVWVFPSVGKARSTFASMSESSVADCFAKVFDTLFKRRFRSDPDIRNLRTAIDQVPRGQLGSIGDDVTGYAGGVEVQLSDGSAVRLLLSNVVIRIGRSITSYSFSSAPSATGDYTSEFLGGVDGAVAATVGRLESALA